MHYGIDVGGTKTEFAVFDQHFSRVHTHRFATATDDYERFLESIRIQVHAADEEYGAQCSVGLGLAGIVDPHGISFSTNVPCLNGHRVADDLREVIGRNVSSINDVRAFALSEARGGAAEGFPTMVGVVLGTGSCSGFCRAGVPRMGADGIAGECGHIPISAVVTTRHELPLFECVCGKKGCIETYASGPGLANLARHVMNEDITPAECIGRMRTGDRAAAGVFSIWIECVANMFLQIILHSNPDVIVIGGGMSNVEELYDQLPRVVERDLLKGVSSPPIRRAMFGDDSGVRGAAMIGADH